MSEIRFSDNFLRKSFRRYLLPTTLAVLGGTVNVFFDGILVGQKLGGAGLAAVGLCSPIYLVLCTLGGLIGSGAAFCSSWAIGQGDNSLSRRFYNTALWLIVGLSLAVAGLGLLLLEPLSQLLSSGGELYLLVRSYAQVTLIGSLPKVLLYLPFYYLRLDGKNGQVTMMTLLMTGLNIGMDALFLFVLEWGIAGAAWASVIATMVAVALGFYHLQQQNSSFRLSRGIINRAQVGQLLRAGTPSALTNLLSAARSLLLNALMLSVGGAPLVSVFTMVTYLSDFSWCLVSGVPQTASPILGIYSSERNNIGIRVLMCWQLRSGLVAIAIYGALVVILCRPLAALFGISGQVFFPLLCVALSLLAAEVNCILIYYYNAIGRVALSNWATAARVLVLAVLPAWLLAPLGQALWLFLPLSELGALLFLLLLVHLSARRQPELSHWLLLDDELTRSGRVLDFSTSSQAEEICAASARVSEFCEFNHLSAKQTMHISLAMEEIMTVMADKCFAPGQVGDFDVRAFAISGTIGIRLRCAGQAYNPFAQAEKEQDAFGELMGVRLIENMAEQVQYQRTFGANSILILL